MSVCRNLDEQMEMVKEQVEKFKIEEITKTEKMILIKARIESAIYFAFYSNFIVCSGDYGEWVFDCTWDTVNKYGNLVLTKDYHYLLGKLSRDCKKYEFDLERANYDIDEWLKEFYNQYDEEEIDEDTKEQINDLVDDLKSNIEEFRIASAVDKFREDMDDLGYSLDDDYELYDVGKIVNWQLVVNLGCLMKIQELNKEEGENKISENIK